LPQKIVGHEVVLEEVSESLPLHTAGVKRALEEDVDDDQGVEGDNEESRSTGRMVVREPNVGKCAGPAGSPV
jgi:hypothetical protein